MTAPVIVCSTGTEAPEEAEATLTLGRKVAAASGTDVRWLLLGAAPDGYADVARRHGVAAVDIAGGDGIDEGDADVLVAAVARYWERSPGQVLVFAQTFSTATSHRVWRHASVPPSSPTPSTSTPAATRGSRSARPPSAATPGSCTR